MLSYMHCILHLTIRSLKSTRLRWAVHVARMEHSRSAYRVLVGKPEGRRPLGRPRCRWEYNIKMDLREVGCDSNLHLNRPNILTRRSDFDARRGWEFKFLSWDWVCVICVLSCVISGGGPDTLLTTVSGRLALVCVSSVVLPLQASDPQTFGL